MRDKPIILFVDLFCGAGGVTEGAVRARMGKYQPMKVVACVNHDPLAIESHEYNHPDTLHFSEDIRTLDTGPLVKIINFYRSKYPKAILCLWASMECTNYSKAKGGMPRDPDSRSLPNEMFRYIDVLNEECGGLDYFKFENVSEFMAWGPLDENGRPVSMKKGQEYLKWVEKIKARGYRYENRILNSADYGAYTKRKRLFGVFAKDDMPIIWPEPTHSENPDKQNMFGTLKKWKPVRDVLDFEDGTILPRKAELILNSRYYPNWPNDRWPVDPDTGERMKMKDIEPIKADQVLTRLEAYLNRPVKDHYLFMMVAFFAGLVLAAVFLV